MSSTNILYNELFLIKLIRFNLRGYIGPIQTKIKTLQTPNFINICPVVSEVKYVDKWI